MLVREIEDSPTVRTALRAVASHHFETHRMHMGVYNRREMFRPHGMVDRRLLDKAASVLANVERPQRLTKECHRGATRSGP